MIVDEIQQPIFVLACRPNPTALINAYAIWKNMNSTQVFRIIFIININVYLVINEYNPSKPYFNLINSFSLQSLLFFIMFKDLLTNAFFNISTPYN